MAAPPLSSSMKGGASASSTKGSSGKSATTSTSPSSWWGFRPLLVDVVLKEDAVAHGGRVQGAVVFNILSRRRPVMVYDIKVTVKGVQKQLLAKVAEDEQSLVNAPAFLKREIDGVMLPAGEAHAYPFEYQLAQSLPGSLAAGPDHTGGLFSVDYHVEVRLCYRQGGAIVWDRVLRRPFVLRDAAVALTKQPVSHTETFSMKRLRFFHTGAITLTANVDAADVVAGQSLAVSCAVLNHSITVIKAMEIRLVRDVDLYAVPFKRGLPLPLPGKANSLAGQIAAKNAHAPTGSPVDDVVKRALAEAAPAAAPPADKDKAAAAAADSGGGAEGEEEAAKVVVHSRRARAYHQRVPRKQLQASGAGALDVLAVRPAPTKVLPADPDDDDDAEEEEDPGKAFQAAALGTGGGALFTVPVPASCAPTWSSVHGRVGYTLEVQLITAVGTDNPCVSFPITVHRCGTVADPAPDPAAAAAAAYYAYDGQDTDPNYYYDLAYYGSYEGAGGEQYIYPEEHPAAAAGADAVAADADAGGGGALPVPALQQTTEQKKT